MKKLLASLLATITAIPFVLITPVVLGETETGTVTVTASISPYLVVTFNYDTVDFGSPSAGASVNIFDIGLNGTLNVTVDTNSDYNVYARGTDWSGPSAYSLSSFPIYFDTDMSSTSDFLGTGKVALTTSDQLIDSYGYAVTGTQYHYYEIVIPSNAPAGTYSNTVTITYQTV